MDFTTIAGALTVILGLVPSLPGPPPHLSDPELASLSVADEPWGNCILPLTVRRQLGLSADDETWETEPFIRYRARWSDLYGRTASPTRAVHMVGDFAPVETLLLAYRPYPEYASTYADLIAWTVDQGSVVVLVNRRDRGELLTLLRRHHIPRSSVTLIELDFDTVWIRDWGPEPVLDDQGLSFIDSRYFLNCFGDDAAPTRLVGQLGGHQVYRPDFWIEGGNIMSNGEGLCLTTTHTLEQHGDDDGHRVRSILREFYGCERVMFLPPLEGNVVQHVDMYLSFANPALVLVGDADVAFDPENHVILDEIARQLSMLTNDRGQHLMVMRVPMPTPREDTEGLNSPLIRSYLNMLPLNDLVFVPVFDDERSREPEALEVIQGAFPMREIVPISADFLAEDNGTIHCITRTIPAVGG